MTTGSLQDIVLRNMEDLQFLRTRHEISVSVVTLMQAWNL